MTSNEEVPLAKPVPQSPRMAPMIPTTHMLVHDRQSRQRVLRIRITDIVTGQLKVGLSLPAGLVSVAMRMGARFVPTGHTNAEVLEAFEHGELAVPLVLEDVENGELVEISVEG
jgi:hypothetical protein